jgi:hypothetical protein
MTLKSGQGLKKCIETSFRIFRVASARSERLDDLPLALNNPAGLGNTTFGRREVVVGVVFSDHNTDNFCRSTENIFDLNHASGPK